MLLSQLLLVLPLVLSCLLTLYTAVMSFEILFPVYLAVRAGDSLVFGLLQQTPVGRYLVQRAEGG